MATASIRTPLLRPSFAEIESLVWARAVLFAFGFVLLFDGFAWSDLAAGSRVAPALHLAASDAPLYALVARLFAFLPFGEAATRLAVLSSLCGAAAALGLAELVYRFFQRRLFAWVVGASAALCWLATPSVHAAANAASLTLPILLAAVLMLHAIADLLAGVRRAGVTLALYGGLCFGFAMPLWLLFGPPLALYAIVKLRRGARWPVWGVPLFFLGATITCYAPMRAAHAFVVSAIFHEAIRHVRALAAPFERAHIAFDRAHIAFFARSLAARIESELQLPALVAAGFGLYVLWRDRVRARYLIYLALLMSVFVDDALTTLLIALCAGVGAAGLSQRLIGDTAAGYRQRLQLAIAASVGMFVCAPSLVATVSTHLPPDSNARLVYAALRLPQSRAVVVTRSEFLTGGLDYERDVARARPDLVTIDRAPLGERALAAKIGPELLHGNIWWEPSADPLVLGHALVHVPLCELRLTKPPLPSIAKVAAEAAWILQPAPRPETALAVGELLGKVGRIYAAEGQSDAAYALYHSALELAPSNAETSLDLAVSLSRRGALYAALYRVNVALDVDPFNESARLLSGRYRLMLGDLHLAEQSFRAAFSHHPSAPPLVGLARVAQRRGRLALAHQLVVEALRVDPKNEEARLLQGELRP